MWSPMRSKVIVIVIASSVFSGTAQKCVPRNFGHGSIVCVCNSTYCDSEARIVPKRGQYRIYDSGPKGNRMSPKTGHFKTNMNVENGTDAITITLDPGEQFQKIYGFGGAFTDSSGINMRKLSEASQNLILESYFGVNGNRYTLGRVPIAGTDFSTRLYTYDDTAGDVSLTEWQLADEDFMYKIPYMKAARNLNPDLKFVSASWTAPPWMKTNNDYSGFGLLRKEYYQLYAEYLAKFLVEYKNQGLEMWAISTGNEPTITQTSIIDINSMGWSTMQMTGWIAENLGPTVAASESNDTIILLIDDQRYNLPWGVTDIFSNPVAKNYTAGIALHWYADSFITSRVIDITHDLLPDKFMLMTEGCVGNTPSDTAPVILGDWTRAETYVGKLMDNLGHWITGFIDWNMVLDKAGGPNWSGNNVDAPIIVNPETDEFFKQPMYYAIAHFSKFIPRGSTRIGTTRSCCVDNLAFVTPANEIVIVLYNSDKQPKTVIMTDPQQGNISTKLSPYSIQTIIYKQ